MPSLPHLLFLIGGGALVAWLLVFAVVLIATRPRRVQPAPPAEAPVNVPGTSRPAVVNLLSHGWRCTPDAVRATLVDLVARGFLGVRQDGPDPAHTRVEIRNPTPPNLSRYERRLMARLHRLAHDGEVSLPSLAFLSGRAASRWFARFASEVAADGRARDVARTGVDTDFLSATSLVPALALGAWTYLEVPTDRVFSAGAVSVALVLLLHQLAVRARDRHRPTPAGLSAAAHWLGVRDHLTKHQPELRGTTLADPRSRDRRTGYAVALGIAPALSEQIRLAPSRTRRVLVGGGTRMVRFPRWLGFCWGWGALGLASAGFAALLAATVTAALVGWYGDYLPVSGRTLGWLAGTLLGVAGLGLLALAAADLAGTRESAGTVVLLEAYGGELGRDPAPTDRYVLAIADGDPDPVDAWILPGYLADGLDLGVRVTVRVRRWTGLVGRLAVAATAGRPIARRTDDDLTATS